MKSSKRIKEELNSTKRIIEEASDEIVNNFPNWREENDPCHKDSRFIELSHRMDTYISRKIALEWVLDIL